MRIIQTEGNKIQNEDLVGIKTRETHQLLCVDGGPIPAIRWLAFQSSVMKIASGIVDSPEGITAMNWFAPININWFVNKDGDEEVEAKFIEAAQKNTQRLQKILTAMIGIYFKNLATTPLNVLTDSVDVAGRMLAIAQNAESSLIDKVHLLTGWTLEDMAMNHARSDYNPANPVAYLSEHYRYYRKPGIHIAPGSEEKFIKMIHEPQLSDVMCSIYPGIADLNSENIIFLSGVRRVPYYLADPNEPSLNKKISLSTLGRKGATQGINAYVAGDNLTDLGSLWNNLSIDPADQRGQGRLTELVNDSLIQDEH
jgi:hypothetical protein